jgi:hypothetical protein
VVNGPPEFVVPVAWQLLLIEHTDVSIGCTSVENLGLIPAHENVIAPPVPPPDVEVPLLLQAIKKNAVEKISKKNTITFFILMDFNAIIIY